ITAPRTATNRRAQSNREAWLTEVVRTVRPAFKRAGHELPVVRVSVGWPGGKRNPKGTTVGQCWSATSATDGRAQIFVSPVVSDGRRAIDILIHELAHAVDHNEHGHSKEFADIAYSLGLEGKPTETHAGPDLAEKASAMVKRLGKYPHAALDEGMTTGAKKQGTRMLKMQCCCPEPRILRLSQTAILAGSVICGVCEQEFAQI